MGSIKQGGRTGFLRNQRGGIAVMAALAMFPLTVLTFAAVEFHRYVDVRDTLQSSLDAATLAVARSTETDPALLNALGAAVLAQSFEGTDYVVSASSFVDASGNVTGSATVTIPPVVSSLFGLTQLSATADSRASRLGRKLEVALVLDNTYSMLTNNRLGITKVAASNFVDTLSEAAARSHVADALKISLVPYSTTVNVGPGARHAVWLDQNAVNPTHHEIFSTPANRFTLFTQMGVTWAGCVESRPAPYDVTDAPPTGEDGRSYFVPYFAPDEHDEWTQAIFRISNNYIPDASVDPSWSVRQKNPAKYVTSPAASTWNDSGYSAGPNYGCKLEPIVRLTTDMAAVKRGISNMTPTGDTYSNIGLVWGWHTLSPNAPFGDGVAYSETANGDQPGPVQKIVVLMTDGENASWNNGSPNASLYSGGGYIGQGRFGITAGTPAERRAALDARMSLVCANMKAKGVVVYVIRVEITGDSPALSGCATSPDKFFNVAAASDLDSVFTKIADSLLNLRLAS